MWPAFWMLGQDFGQVGWPASVEIEHHGERRHELGRGARHPPRPRLLRRRGHHRVLTICRPVRCSRNAFHTFAIDWAPDVITLVRGRTGSTSGAPPPIWAGAPGSSTSRSSCLLNLAIGGTGRVTPTVPTALPAAAG
ncbi:hypothetical protein D1794_30125 (plasmid) [Streptomyces clavuligerus]|nr:hypothetical protein D1794_30125 [Streptomyces clavuligerus]